MNNKTITVVDVRTPQEYAGGHVVDSLNIPLNELPANIDKLKSIDGSIILCCASGARSNMARQILMQNGIANVTDGGPWTNVNFQLNNQN
jgi:rhodanese-related sulfurtransferase